MHRAAPRMSPAQACSVAASVRHWTIRGGAQKICGVTSHRSRGANGNSIISRFALRFWGPRFLMCLGAITDPLKAEWSSFSMGAQCEGAAALTTSTHNDDLGL